MQAGFGAVTTRPYGPVLDQHQPRPRPLTLRIPQQLCLPRGAGTDRQPSVAAGMAEASQRSGLPRLRLLCLHSFRTSAAIFQDQVLRSFVHRLPKWFGSNGVYKCCVQNSVHLCAG